jgi:hypothetical protein
VTIVDDRLALLEALQLDRGSHEDWEHGACVMEAVAYVAGEPWSDHPKCASPIITSFLIGWNDALPDDQRQILKPYIPRLVGTRVTAADDEQRAWILTDWLARECAPAWLRLAGLTAEAESFERLAPILDFDAAQTAQPALDAARTKSAAAWAAAWPAARDAVWPAARDAAWDAAWAAAWAAARDAAGAAARDAAWAAARDAAGAAARDAARAAARDAARADAGDAAWAAAGDAARDAARAAARDAAWAAVRDAAWAAAGAAARDAAGAAAWAAARSGEDQYQSAYDAAKPLIEEKFASVTAGLQQSALLMLDRLIEAGR